MRAPALWRRCVSRKIPRCAKGGKSRRGFTISLPPPLFFYWLIETGHLHFTGITAILISLASSGVGLVLTRVFLYVYYFGVHAMVATLWSTSCTSRPAAVVFAFCNFICFYCRGTLRGLEESE